MAYYQNIYVSNLLVSPGEAKNNVLVTLVDGNGAKIDGRQYLLDINDNSPMLFTALSFAMANFANSISVWTTDTINSDGRGYITGILVSGATPVNDN